MSTTGEKGFVFSLDLMLAFLAMLLMLSLMLSQLHLLKEEQLQQSKKLSLQRNAVLLIDAMAKNRDEKQPLLGSASYDKEKHRVQQNSLDPAILLSAKQLQSKDFYVSSFSFSANGFEKKVLAEKPGKNCVSLDRIVLIEGKTGKLEVTLCEKQSFLPQP